MAEVESINGNPIVADISSESIVPVVDAWLTAHPEATATVADGAITTVKLADGAVTDAKLAQTGNILSRVAVYALTQDNFDFGFQLGSVNNTGVASSTTRIRSYFLRVSKGDYFTVGSAGDILAVHLFNADGSYYGNLTPQWTYQATVAADGYAVVMLRKLSNEAIADSEIADIAGNLSLVANGVRYEQEVDKAMAQNALTKAVPSWDNRRFNFSSGRWESVSNAIGMQAIVTAPTDLVIRVDDGYKFGYGLFSGTNAVIAEKTYSSGWLTSEVAIPAGSNFLINLAKTNNAAMKPMFSEHIRFDPFRALEMKIDGESDSSVVGPDFVRRGVKTTLLGTLAKVQAFCVYGGKYYSTDGSDIVVQDSSFNVEQTVTRSLGHGNSLQLGSNGIAYASGWNDDTVYAVNLSTLEIASTIDLTPINSGSTLGYTTAAIDDLNGIAYVFQRNSYPDTVAMYDFIAYDYANQHVLARKKFKAFAAMQACDFYEGRIIVAYGFGTTAAPSGMFVCNTNGDVLAEYDLSIFATVEPEGVCFDRYTHELLVSTVNKSLHKVESA